LVVVSEVLFEEQGRNDFLNSPNDLERPEQRRFNRPYQTVEVAWMFCAKWAIGRLTTWRNWHIRNLRAANRRPHRLSHLILKLYVCQQIDDDEHNAVFLARIR
jgi:hypothetical protein